LNQFKFNPNSAILNPKCGLLHYSSDKYIPNIILLTISIPWLGRVIKDEHSIRNGRFNVQIPAARDETRFVMLRPEQE
jgi:hypothetical protein